MKSGNESSWPLVEKGKVAGFVLSLWGPPRSGDIIVVHLEAGVEPQDTEITQVIQPDYQTRQKFILMRKEVAPGPRPVAQSMNCLPSDLL